jgi:hypothetical protein
MIDPLVQNVLKYIKDLPEFDNAQNSTLEQLIEVYLIAVALKLYDAAEALERLIKVLSAGKSGLVN